MNPTNPRPFDEKLAALLAAADKEAPPPDRAFLDRLRDQSLAAFPASNSQTTPSSPRKRFMFLSSLRWMATGLAAMLILGLVLARYVIPLIEPEPDNQPPEEKFALNEKLIDDGRIGKVVDSQGIVSIKPVLHERWSPVQSRLVLKPGDWLRTDARGANAAALKFINSTSIIVGPHSTVELVKPTEIHLLAGELEISATANSPVELQGPDNQKLEVKDKQVFRIEKEKLVRVDKEPLWLQSFKGATANESIGSLIASVDGRNVPLTVGFHRVTVDIRDQIARTTIEESFVNRTPQVLEGVFHFPLPADASISGFGMWIGDKLVEADIVEKERAREIYETILREKRDPGLLEWTGGNIFKARVYPIPGNSEKRIRITYTQVLPMQGNRYRYSYGLLSELLKQHPLRELTIDLKVNSAVPLKGVSSPTHTARIDKTEHSGYVEFSAQEYTPTRDFEAVIEVDNRQSDVVVIPHRRGDDGYFMVQLTPPGAAGDWERPLIPNGTPLRLLLLADTSASMDRGQRATQNAVLASLLGALTPKDVVNVAACDVNCDWIFEKPVAATPENIATIQQTLAKRISLGWTDLDKAFASALKMCDSGTQVVYIGDGIVTTGDADPVAFAQRLHRLYEGKAGTFHAVTVGSSFEPAVLKAIASLGGGSVRRVSGEHGPQATALELLSEIATPALRDLKVEFKGLRTARVYPDDLPNIAAGSQQILLGRYLPEGKDQTGEIIVSGMLGTKPVRYTSKVSLKDAEAGNSFIPRLWARMYLDKLLEQGASESVKQEIIGLSEEFQIITPLTSLLVLETDADRERFAVKRRFQMRDGEKFFAEGRENAAYELKQKQMKLAGDYRTALRRQILSQFMEMGRNARLLRGHHPSPEPGMAGRPAGDPAGFGGGGDIYYPEELGVSTFSSLGAGKSMISGEFTGIDHLEDSPFPSKDAKELSGNKRQEQFDEEKSDGGDIFERGVDKSLPMLEAQGALRKGNRALGLELDDFGIDLKRAASPTEPFDGLEGRRDDGFGYLGRPKYRGNGYQPSQLQWLDSIFPSLAAAPGESKEQKSTWPAPALALSRSLLRTEKLLQQKGGIVIARRSDGFDPRFNELSSRSNRLELVSPTAWLGRTIADCGPVTISWCDAKEFGAYTTGYQLGRVRASNEIDLHHPPLELEDESVLPLHRSYANYSPTIERIAQDRALLILKDKYNSYLENRFFIDTKRHVLLSIEHRFKDKVTATTKFDDFVEVAGSWWARRTETFDDKGRRLTLTTQTIIEISADDFSKRLTQELSGKEKILFLRQPMPSVAEAKASVAAGKATFDDRAVLTLHFAASQQWARAKEHLEQCQVLAAGKPGMRWLTDAFLFNSRRHEELRKRLLDEAAALANANDADTLGNAYFLAKYINRQAEQAFGANEAMALLEKLKIVYERQPAYMQAMKTWRNWQFFFFLRTGESDQLLPLSKALAVDYPHDMELQLDYAMKLFQTGDYAGADAWFNRVLMPEAKWDVSEEEALRDQYADLLERQDRYRDLVDFCTVWMKRNPESTRAYDTYLTALIRSGQWEKAETLTLNWMREVQRQGELPPDVAARLSAAVKSAMNFSIRLIEERWQKALIEVALFFAPRGDQDEVVKTILENGRYHVSDVALAVRKALAGILQKEIGTLSAARIDQLVTWVWSDSGLESGDWKAISEELRKRWNAEKKPELKHQFGQTLLRVLQLLGSEDALAFLRLQWKEGPEEYRALYANLLFDALLSRNWSIETEDETFSLLDKLAEPTEAAAGLYTQVAALHRLTDAMLQNRYQARMKMVEHQEKLTRTELHKKQDENLKLAREGYAEHLRSESTKHNKLLAGWLDAERYWIDVLLERNFDQIADECWKVLNTPSVNPKPDDESSAVEARMEELLRVRLLAVVENLAARKGANPASIDRLLKFIDQQIKEKPDDKRWRSEKYRLLIAFDHIADLEKELRQWAAEPDPENRWKLALGYLLAEQGKVADAIKLFEAVEAADELSPAAYRSLADWYQVENRRDLYQRAQVASFKTEDEYRLSQRINIYLRPWQYNAGRIPTQFDPEVLLVFKALFEKSSSPQSYLNQLLQFYQASRDFRLLSMLPDGVIGHSAGEVYPFLQGMRAVLGEVRDEATADELVARIANVRASAKTAIDLRALDLLELLVERRAAELQNHAGPHVDKALTVMQRSFKQERSPGEPKLMAEFLANLGAIGQPPLAQEQLRQLESLLRDTLAGSLDRLQIADSYARTLNGYSRTPEAIDVLGSALKGFEDANGGILPTYVDHFFRTLISYTTALRHYEAGEKLFLAHLQHPIHTQQKYHFIEDLNDLYINALRDKGTVSLGSGATLYKALEAKIFADLKSFDVDFESSHRFLLLQQLLEFYRTAHRLQIAGVGEDLKAFAFNRLVPIIQEQSHVRSFDSIITEDVAEALHTIAGPRDAMAFLLYRLEKEPAWYPYMNYQGSWNQYSWKLGQWRLEAKDIGVLEPRLLKYILTELRRDLHSRETSNRTFYDRRHGYYWPEKEADFAKAAEEIYAERKSSGAAVEFIAEYLFFGLPREQRAIEILFAAHQQKILSESGQWQLIDYLHRVNRFAESIPLLLPLVEKRPDNLAYRTKLMHAYYRTGKQTELLALLKQTDAYFHEKDRWYENPLATLAYSCLENHLFTQSAAYYEELIPLHQRTQQNRGIGNGTLSNYYSYAAKAYAGLGKTKQAVDMASGAVVSWGPHIQQRNQALEALVRVLADAPDLAAYVADLDKEKLQSPIVRKAIGKAYISKNDYIKAIPQFQLAAELQPNDSEIYQDLIVCYDKAGDKEGAIRQLLQAVELSRRDGKLYEQLGQRFTEQNQPTEAERAYTSIVEMQVNESESHAMLAEVRERQNRWPEAIAQWERVAKLRSLEPTGLLKLAAAQIHEKAWDQAAKTLQKLRAQSWQPRFGDVQQQARDLEKKMEGQSNR